MKIEVTGRRSPYQGLIPYDEEDAAFFVGRETETKIIIANLFASPLTLLYGDSGVGKSSVLRAGVAHELRQRDDLLVVVFSDWQGEPLNDLKAAVAKAAFANVTSSEDALKFKSKWSEPFTKAASLSEYLTIWTRRLNCRLMVILDQFEEYSLYHPQDDAFALEFPQAVLQTEAPISFLISIREDSLAKLDRFEGRIPNIFDNYLRIEHLSRAAARQAIEIPIEKYNQQPRAAGEPQPRIEKPEPALVNAVLDQIATGQVTLGEAGRGVLKTETTEAQIETPYLQLVMTRLWDEEMRADSRQLRLATLTALGGAERIVRTHLDTTMSALPKEKQDIAAKVFHYLVTPSGTKIAHTIPDLADYAELQRSQLAPAMEELASGDIRILRGVAPPPDQPGESRYEIFHDVLAAAILDWRSRHVQARERAEAELLAEEQRREAAERARVAEKMKTAGRLRWLSIALALMTLLAMATAVYAFRQRGRAVADAAQAQTQAEKATVARTAAEKERELAEEQRGLADVQRKRADEQALIATKQTEVANEKTEEAIKARGEAEEQRKRADEQAKIAREQAAEAEEERKRADEQAELARASAVEANKASEEAVAARKVAEAERQRANQQAAIAKSRELATAARSNLNTDPELSVLLALRAVSEFTGENLTEAEKQGFKEIDRKDAIEALHEAVQSSRIRRTFTAHSGNINEIAYGLNGRRLITLGAESLMELWDATSGQRLRELSGKDNVNEFGIQIALSHDGTRLATNVTGTGIDVLDLTSGESVRTFADDDTTMQKIAFSKDDSILAVASKGNIRLWNIKTGQKFELPAGQEFAPGLGTEINPYKILTFSEDGKTLVAGGCINYDDGCTAIGLKAWDVATRQESRQPVTRNFGKYMELEMTFSPDAKRLFTNVKHRTAEVWDATSGKKLFGFDVPRERIVTERRLIGNEIPVVFSRDGKKLAALTASGEIKLWDATTGEYPTTLHGQISNIDNLVFSPDGKRLAASSRGIVKLWDTTHGEELLTLSDHEGWINSIAFSPDGEFLAIGNDHRVVKLWDISPTKELPNVLSYERGLKDLIFSADETRLAGFSRSEAKVWDAESGKELLSPDHGDLIVGIDYSLDGKRLATLDIGAVKIWEVPAGNNIRTIDLTTANINGPLRYVALSPPAGKLLAMAAESETAQLWDVATGKKLHDLPGHTKGVSSLTFSPNGEYIAITSRGSITKVWDVKTGEELHTLGGHVGEVKKAAFSRPDGKRLATAGADKYIRIWDVSTGKELPYISGDGGVIDVTFSPDGRLIATVSGSGTAKVWDASTGLELLSLTDHTSGAHSVAFSPDGLRLIVSGSETTIVYTLEPQKLVSLAQERVSRHELTPDERKRYLHEVTNSAERPQAEPK